MDGRQHDPDQAINELAGLMHDRLIGALRVEREADGLDWHALLLLLAQSPEELIATGGIAQAWATAGRNHFEIREIDYAELLREREGARTEWDQIIRLCLRGDANNLDEAALLSLLESLGDSHKFGELLERLQTIAELGEPTISARVSALLELVTRMLDVSAGRSGDTGRADVLQTVAESTSRLTPDMLIGLLEHARAAEGQRSEVASEVVERIDDPTVASFVARLVERESGASERLALALQLLVPDLDRKVRLLDLARDEAAEGPLGRQSGFAELWQRAADMLASYSDETFVSDEYARELSSAHTQALEVERVSDDPPHRVETWLATVDDAALRELDLSLLLDLLRIETELEPWRDVAKTVVTEIERRTQRGDMPEAQKLAFALVVETSGEGRSALKSAAESALETLAEGPLAKHVATSLRTADDADVESYGRLCRTVGTRIDRSPGRSSDGRGKQPRHPPAARGAAWIRGSRARHGRAAEAIATGDLEANRDRDASHVRWTGCPSGPRRDARRQGSAGSTGRHSGHRADWKRRGVRCPAESPDGRHRLGRYNHPAAREPSRSEGRAPLVLRARPFEGARALCGRPHQDHGCARRARPP